MSEEQKTKADQDKSTPDSTTTRRKVIKTAVTGGAIVVGTTQSEITKWAKPVVQHTLLPAHAATSVVEVDEGDTCSLSCTPGVAGVNRVSSDATNITRSISQRDVTATVSVCSNIANVPVSIATSTTPVGGTVITSGASVGTLAVNPSLTDASGVATFSEIDAFFQVPRFEGGSIRLDMVFSAEGQTETCSVTFVETAVTPPEG